MADLDSLRAEFPILARRNYLNSCSLGALSARSRAAVGRFLDLWEEKGARAWYEDWMAEIARLESLYARAIGADPDEVSYHPSVSSALSTVASCLEGQAPGVLMCDLDFPTVGHQFLARSPSASEPTFVQSPDGVRVPPELFEARLSPRVGLLATLHVYYTSGYIQDLGRLARAAHAHGAWCLGDGYQAVGSIPVDVRAMEVDFYVGGSLKWLCGGPGAAFLYVRREIREQLRPMTTGWFSQRRQFEFMTTELEYAEDGRRFRTGSPAIGAVYAAAAGCEIILEQGVDSIREAQVRMTSRLVAGATRLGLEVASPLDPMERGGIVVIRVEDPQFVVRELLARGIVTDYRPGKLRLSAHFYNTDQECDQAIEALGQVLGRR